jgi:hypothetical protein
MATWITATIRGTATVGRRRRAATGRSTTSRGMKPAMDEGTRATLATAPPMNAALELSVAAAVAAVAPVVEAGADGTR